MLRYLILICILLLPYALQAERYSSGESRISGAKPYGTGSGPSFFSRGGLNSVYGVQRSTERGSRMYGVRNLGMKQLVGAAVSGNRRLFLNRLRILGGNASISGFRAVRR